MSVPDLLHQVALDRALGPKLREALTFAFARGEREERLVALSLPPLKASTFDRECFGADLFLEALASGVFRLGSTMSAADSSLRFFLQILTSPVCDMEDLELRHGILRELSEQPERLVLLRSAYASLTGLLEVLSASSQFETRSLGVRRRIDILVAIRRAFLDLDAATNSSDSALRRISVWVNSVFKSPAFIQLRELLSFEDGRSVLVTQLQVGMDGRLRRFDILRTEQAEHRSFPRSPFSRFVRRLVSLLRGYRFSEEDVLGQLLDQVFSSLEEEIAGLLQVTHALSFYLRGVAFREEAERVGLSTCLPVLSPLGSENRERTLLGLFNPWLLAQGQKAVPADFNHQDAACTTIVTGPNSGGKTRLMQALALTQLLAQAGLFVPARVARIPLVSQLYLSLIEGAHADQSEGRLGLELMRIREVFEKCGKDSLVIMDELCSGTNPSEGERIFGLVLELFEELRPQVLITTHFLDFAERLRLNESPRLDFRQVELDEANSPTYQFVPGVAQTSLAQTTAARLGVTREELLALIALHKR